MPDLPADLLVRTLSPTDGATALRVQAGILHAFPGLTVLAAEPISLDDYEELGLCRATLLASPAAFVVHGWGGLDDDRLVPQVTHGCRRVEWRGHTFHVVSAGWQEGYNKVHYDWVVGHDEAAIRELILDAARATNDPRDSILVFHGACWQKSKELYASTQKASFDDLVLAGPLKERIRRDFREFLGARAAYERLGLPWRRGVLLLGPPGNGKTHCVRALVKELGVASLYVQSVRHRYETDEANLKKVFERARQLRPCVLVFEDIDAMITGENRSFFLNQLDGFDKNVGLVVIATTNHPERLDPAILDRPSRFDRKYHFELPVLAERLAYLASWRERLATTAPWDIEATTFLAERTDGFSFAYLKELVVSALSRVVSNGDVEMAVHLREECEALRAQRASGVVMGSTSAVGDVEEHEGAG